MLFCIWKTFGTHFHVYWNDVNVAIRQGDTIRRSCIFNKYMHAIAKLAEGDLALAFKVYKIYSTKE